MKNNLIKIDYEKSSGSYVFDKNTNTEFLDLLNHYSSLPLGYNHPELKSPEFKEEIMLSTYMKASVGLYDSDEKQEFIKEFREFSVPDGFDMVHFTCTGSLAIESAIKTAWKHSDYKKSNIAVITNSFHGLNSFGNFLTTRFDSRLENIPAPEWVQFYDMSLPWAELHKLGAILIEPIQSTYGDNHISADFIRKCRKLCDQLSIPLIFDEIQTGFGATGAVWYYQHLGIEPDILVLGKKAQVSGIIVRKGVDKIKDEPHKLSVTFDGTESDMIRCKYIIRAIKEHNLLQNIADMGTLLMNSLKEISKVSEEITNVRGIGGLIAFDLESTASRDAFIKNAYKNNLIVNSGGERTIRLRPNLAITQDEVFDACKKIRKSL